MARISRASEIYAAARIWMDKCLVGDGSVFLPEQRLWTIDNVRTLRDALVERPTGDVKSFEAKLEKQLAAGPPWLIQLAAETIWVLFLFPHRQIETQRKRDLIRLVWSWSSVELDPTHPMLSDAVLAGIGSPGPAFNAGRDREVAGLIDAILALKERGRELPSLDPFAVGELMDAQPRTARRNIRNMLLHLLYPDLYERIASHDHKHTAALAFARLIDAKPITTPMVEVDRQLHAIREKLQERYPDRQIDFYDPEIRAIWSPPDEAPAAKAPRRSTVKQAAKAAEEAAVATLEAASPAEPDLVAQEADVVEQPASDGHALPESANDETRAGVWMANELANRASLPGATPDLLFASLIHMSSDGEYGSPAAGAVNEQMKKSLAARGQTLSPAQVMAAHYAVDPSDVTTVQTGWSPGPTLAPILDAADEVRTRVGKPRLQPLSPRHILAVLLRPGPHSVDPILRGLSFEPADLRAALLQSIMERRLGEDREEWRRLLEIEEAPDVALYAGFSTDALRTGDTAGITREDDRLNVMRDVTALAEVLAARDTKPPLAVGLFGDWGTGKSFFMELMRQEIELLGHENPAFYCERVVQVWFNAWHYMEANLWASLAAQVFEELAEHIEKKWKLPHDQRAELFERLQESQGVLAEAVSERNAADQRLKAIQTELTRREQSLAGAAQIAFGAAVDSIRADAAVQDRLQEVSKEIGLRDAQAAVEKAAEQGREVLSLGRRIAAISHALRQNRARLVIGIAVFLAVTGGVAWAVWRQWEWGIVPQALTGLAAGLTAARAVVAPVIKEVNRAVGWLEGIVSRLRDRAENERRERELVAQRELMRLEQRHREAQAQVDALNREIEDLRAGRRLQRFILERHTSAEYRQHLGLVNLIRNDFERLSKLLLESQQEDGDAAKAASRPAADQPQPNVGAPAASSVVAAATEPAPDAAGTAPQPVAASSPGDPSATPAADVAQGDGAVPGEAKPAAPLPKIDRIILYIDDLDRCPEDRVVQVLQAVHLLLAFPLFVVVVGVDSRWLLLSLEDHYAALRGTSAPSREDGKANGKKPDPELSATPQNYLEKIFQIPFSLRPMESGGFSDLVTSLLPIGEDEEETDDERTEPQPRSRLASDDGDGEQEETRGEPSPPDDAGAGDTEDGEDGEMLEDEPDGGDEEDDGGSADDSEGDHPGAGDVAGGMKSKEEETPVVKPNPLGLTISKGERDFIARLHPLIASPRALKRFTNVYRFLRVQQRGAALDRFRGSDGRAGEFQVVALLLGAVVGYPAEAAHLLRAVLANPGDWWALVEKLGDAGAEEDAKTRAEAAAAAPPSPFAEDGRRTLREALQEVKKMGIVGEHAPRTFAEWTREVARFSFQSGRILSIRGSGDAGQGDAEPSAKEMA